MSFNHMDLNSDLQELLALEDQPIQFLSVYLDTSVNQDGQRTHSVYFKKKVSMLAKLQETAKGEAAAQEFRRNASRIEEFLATDLDKTAQSVALFCSLGRDYFKAIQIPVPVQNKFVVSTSPNLDVLIELAEESRHYCVVVLDQHSGRIFSVYLSRRLGDSRTLSEEIPGRNKVGGWSQMRYQRHRQDLIQHFMKDLAEELDRYVRREKPDSVVILGTQANTAEFRRRLGYNVSSRLLLTAPIPTHDDESELITKTRALIEAAGKQNGGKMVSRLYDRLCQDYMAVVGLDETLFSLQMGRLERLFISNRLAGRGYRCTHCEFVFSRDVGKCPYCGNSAEPVELRNRLEKLAERHDVSIELVNDPTFLDSLGGTGGFLKF